MKNCNFSAACDVTCKYFALCAYNEIQSQLCQINEQLQLISQIVITQNLTRIGVNDNDKKN